MLQRYREERRAAGQIPPLDDLIGLEYARGQPTPLLRLPFTDQARGAVAPVHGAIFALLADVACVLSMLDTFDPDVEMPVTTDVHLRYYRQPESWPITAEDKLVHKGRTSISAECAIADDDDRQLVRATATYMIVRGFGDLRRRPIDGVTS